jgi:excisionase family DNA binding protein
LVWSGITEHTNIDSADRSAGAAAIAADPNRRRTMIPSQPPPTKAPSIVPTADPTLPPRTWTYAEVALTMRVQKQTVYEWVKRGMIPSPTYIGFTARFTDEQMSAIMSGVKAPGTFKVTPSPRSEIGKLGGPRPKAKKRKATSSAAKGKQTTRPSRKGGKK